MNDEEIIKTFKGNLIDYITKLKEAADKVNQLQSNGNTLREWLEKQMELHKDHYKAECLKDVLDKMNELESGGKDNA